MNHDKTDDISLLVYLLLQRTCPLPLIKLVAGSNNRVGQ